MQSYSYVARDAAGRRMKGLIRASDEPSARAKLREMGVYVTSLSRVPSWVVSLRRPRVPSAEILLLSEELAALLHAGIPLGRAINTLAHQTHHAALRRVLMEVREDVHRGRSLADALARHPRVFSHFYIQLVRVGETSGQLDKMLHRIVEHLESEREIKQKVLSALAYPTFVLIISAFVIAVLMVFVMPRFQVMYQQLGASLPLPTRVLIAASQWCRRAGWLGLLAIPVSALLLAHFREHPRVRPFLDRLSLRIPLVGRVLQQLLTVKFLHVLGVLINSGVPMIESLLLIETTTSNHVLRDLVRRLRLSVSRGQAVAQSLMQEPLLSPVATQMVAAGEESGDLGTMLLRASDFLRRELDVLLKRLINALGPALTVLLAFFVGGIVLSIYLPIFEITSKLGR